MLQNSECAKCKALLKCGIEGSNISFTTTGQSINTNLVNIDISCFKAPLVAIGYSSQVNVVIHPDDSVTPPKTAEVVLRYDLISRTENGETVVGSWIYSRILTPTSTSNSQSFAATDAFSFNKCLFPKLYHGCIDYFIRITAIKISIDNNIM